MRNAAALRGLDLLVLRGRRGGLLLERYAREVPGRADVDEAVGEVGRVRHEVGTVPPHPAPVDPVPELLAVPRRPPQVLGRRDEHPLAGECARVLGEEVGHVVLELVRVDGLREHRDLLHEVLEGQQVIRRVVPHLPTFQRLPPVPHGLAEAQRAHVAQARVGRVARPLEPVAQRSAKARELVRLPVRRDHRQRLPPLGRVGARDELRELVVYHRAHEAEERPPSALPPEVLGLGLRPQVGPAAAREDERVGELAGAEAALDGRLEVAHE
mmetsp:Transcript_420/g.1091  ORF Transcript_420/g.1091 Transcript_420/m.1091 type:complete len:270 (-) Transcript_420:1224-2033(-)